MDLSAWLRGLGLGQYEQAFRDNAIEPEVLPQLTAEDLKEIGVVPVGHRRKLLDAIAALRVSEAPASVRACRNSTRCPTRHARPLLLREPIRTADKRSRTLAIRSVLTPTPLELACATSPAWTERYNCTKTVRDWCRPGRQRHCRNSRRPIVPCKPRPHRQPAAIARHPDQGTANRIGEVVMQAARVIDAVPTGPAPGPPLQ
jgi:SAM domain (Sterile alpha motif)